MRFTIMRLRAVSQVTYSSPELSIGGEAMNIFARSLLLALCVVACTAAASDKSREKAITEAIQTLVPNATIDSIEPSPLDGFYAVVVGGQVVYVSDDGKYLIQGNVFDLASRTDLTAVRMDKVRKAALAKVPDSERIVFAPESPKYTVSVFTDLDCGYCRKMHSQIAEFNKNGIAIEYLFYPRNGLDAPSYHKAVSVFCADNPQQAFTLAKQGAEPEQANCDNPVAAEFALGNRIGVTGTPTVIGSDGHIIGNYMTPVQLLARLRARDAAPVTTIAH